MFAELGLAVYEPVSPESGILATRAWATQEWLLSRRIIFYTEGCLAWSCKVSSQRETGGSFHNTARNPRWKNLIEKYSARALTRATDRLIALEGIRTEMGKKRDNDVYCFGLWKHSMPDQLLWFCRNPAQRADSPLELPTWTWASTMRGVRFFDIRKAKNACGGFHFDEKIKTLVIRGALRVLKPNSLLPTTIETTPPIPTMQNGVPPEMSATVYAGDGTVSGWAVVDEGRPTAMMEIYCLELMSRKVTARLADSVKQSHFESWVLFLQRKTGLEDTYERIGAGLISSASAWFEQEARKNVYLR